MVTAEVGRARRGCAMARPEVVCVAACGAPCRSGRASWPDVSHRRKSRGGESRLVRGVVGGKGGAWRRAACAALAAPPNNSLNPTRVKRTLRRELGGSRVVAARVNSGVRAA